MNENGDAPFGQSMACRWKDRVVSLVICLQDEAYFRYLLLIEYYSHSNCYKSFILKILHCSPLIFLDAIDTVQIESLFSLSDLLTVKCREILINGRAKSLRLATKSNMAEMQRDAYQSMPQRFASSFRSKRAWSELSAPNSDAFDHWDVHSGSGTLTYFHIYIRHRPSIAGRRWEFSTESRKPL